MAEQNEVLEQHINKDYEWGFTTQIDSDTFAKGLNEDVVKALSRKKNEPEWMLEFRLKAYKHWLGMKEPNHWAHLPYPKINFQDISYYSAPKKKPELKSLDEVDPELLKTFEKLGISLEEQKRLSGVQSNIAVDAVFDSVSVKTTFRETLAEKGIIFCSFSEAVIEYPELIQKYMGSVVPYGDNYYAALNSAVFSDGSFCVHP
jgi:Fe-S cluster assembly protein SufB